MGSCSESSTTGKREAETVDCFMARMHYALLENGTVAGGTLRYGLILLFELCTLDSLFNLHATLQVSCKLSAFGFEPYCKKCGGIDLARPGAPSSSTK
jgi:hypothetical protein